MWQLSCYLRDIFGIYTFFIGAHARNIYICKWISSERQVGRLSAMSMLVHAFSCKVLVEPVIWIAIVIQWFDPTLVSPKTLHMTGDYFVFAVNTSV